MATFCKTIKVKENLHTCVVPRGFLGDDTVVPTELSLVNASGLWSVAVSEDCGDLLLGKGWRSFCLDNKLDIGDVMVMMRVQSSNVMVLICDRDGYVRKQAEKVPASTAPVKDPEPVNVPEVVQEPEPEPVKDHEVLNDPVKDYIEVSVKDHEDQEPVGKQFVSVGKAFDMERRDGLEKDSEVKVSDDETAFPKRNLERDAFDVPPKKRAKSSGLQRSGSDQKLQKVTVIDNPNVQKVSWTSSKSALAEAAKFESQGPSLLIRVTRSTLNPSYSLHVYREFSLAFMPRGETSVMLVNSKNEKLSAKWLGHRHLMSGGWRSFARAEKLQLEDAIVLEVVDRTTYKIHVFRG